jgi:hypothetical protein
MPVESEPFTLEMAGPPPGEDVTLELPAPNFGALESESSDRRVKSRSVLRVQARICVDGDEPLDAHTIDLSCTGLAITSTRPLNVDQECTVELGVSVPEIAQPPALRASVRYCAQLRDDQFRIGLKFTAMSVEAAELIVAVLDL